MYEIMICPIKQLYNYADEGDMGDVAVLAVSSYEINQDKLINFGYNHVADVPRLLGGGFHSDFQ